MPDDDDDLDLDTTPKISAGVAVRLSKLSAQKRELRGQLDTAQARITELEGLLAERDATINGFEPMQAELAGLKTEKASWAEERSMITAGVVSEDDQAIARTLHGRLPPENRPQLGDWLGQMAKGKAEIPNGLAHVYKAKTAEDAGAGGNADTRGGQRADGQQAAGQPLSAEAIRAIRERCVKSGNWDEWKKVRGEAYS